MHSYDRHGNKRSFSLPRTLVFLCLFLFSLGAIAQETSASEPPSEIDAIKAINGEALGKLQQRLGDIKQKVSAATTDKQLSELNTSTLELVNETSDDIQLLLPALTQIKTQLDVIGPLPAADMPAEPPEVARQRRALTDSKTQMEKNLSQLETLRTDATSLSKHIVELRRSTLKTQLALNSGSILSWRFWSVLFTPQSEDLKKFDGFGQQWQQSWDSAFTI